MNKLIFTICLIGIISIIIPLSYSDEYKESQASIYSKNGDKLRVLKLNQEVDIIFNFEFNGNNTSDGFVYYNIKETDKLLTQSQNFTSFEIPKTFKFSYTPSDIGNFPYSHGAASHTNIFHRESTEIITVIDHYSKAMQESNGNCKSPFPEFVLVIKPDFSTGACVKMDTSKILKERGWF